MADEDRQLTIDKGRLRWALLTAGGFRPADRHVGLMMLERINRERYLADGALTAWEGIDALGRLTGLSRRTIQSAWKALVGFGAIEAERPGGHGRTDTTTWRFNLAWADRVTAQVKLRPKRSLKSRRAQPATPLTGPVECAAEPLRAQPDAAEGAIFRTVRAHSTAPESSDENPLSESAALARRPPPKGRERKPLDWHQVLARVCRVTGYRVDQVEGLLLANGRCSDGESAELHDPATTIERVREIIQMIKRRASSALAP